ncbi:MAG: RNA 2',3'-cyclic phosphodiesterase [Verrucomicrobia bacterium]|nr:RNA 2',3'-cyclic phosphodiesterase [Verrucomicrobiota bacterium]
MAKILPTSPGHAGPTERLFVALALPAPVRDALAALAQPLPGVTWTRPEQLHITLRFLGDVPVDKIEPMIARLAGVRVAPFVLPVEGTGAFPPNRPPRIVWAGTGSGHPHLFQLRQRLDDSLLAAGVQFDVRTFHAHATLARCSERAGAALTHWLHVHREFAAPPFWVDAFELYASDLQPGGAVHTLKHRFPLAN